MLTKKKVLVVDDEQDIVEILSYNLSKQDLEVKRAYSGKECIQVARNFLPDLIVMDIRMPDVNGIEACRILKKDEELRNIPILFLTADTDVYTALSAMSAGGDHYVTKPIPISTLSDMIHKMIDGEQIQSRIRA
jgi:two-component system alkaline phosphatase synthesis response regulator PhoP